jgi:hypothetical protein
MTERCRFDLRASAALVLPEVLNEQPVELLRCRIVGRLVGPRVARLEDCRWRSSSRSQNQRPTAADEVFLVDHDVQYSPRLLVEVTVIRDARGRATDLEIRPKEARLPRAPKIVENVVEKITH